MRIGDYEIGGKLGRGAMGDVWLARDANGRELALKTLSAVLAGKDPAYVARFVREAKAACTIAHPCVVAVYEMGVADGVHFIAMEYAAGGSVHDLLTKHDGQLSVERAMAIVRDVAGGLGAAATEGLVHRDIKPANILLRKDGKAMLGDLGLVRASEGELSNTLTLTGATLGTPAYMSPEQAHDAKTADVRSDIYSLGATLYQMVTGTLPFAGDTGIDILMKQVEEPLPDPRSRNPQLDERTALIITRMMAKNGH
ncbi:MAG: serine/threonine protein kinase, partial [Rhodothermales bacterium]